MLMMWNVEEGLNQIDKYFHNSEELVKAGACLGVGLISIGVCLLYLIHLLSFHL